MAYHYETLSPERFQHLCQSLLTTVFPNVQCLPVGQSDGGRDLLLRFQGQTDRKIAFQVKFIRNPTEHPNSRKILDQVIAQEGPKVAKLKKAGYSEYYLLTNLRGTAHFETGSIDRVEDILTSAFDLPSYCWWRDDLDRRIDTSNDLKWSFPEIIRGTDVLQALLEGKIGEGAAKRDNAIRMYLAAQYEADEDLRFKQVELQSKLIDLFVDLPLEPIHTRARMDSDESSYSGRYAYHAFRQHDLYHWHHGSFSDAIATLTKLDDQKAFSRIVIEGGPGQGKSTITQFICQLHRMTLLDRTADLSQLPEKYRSIAAQLPIRVDLRDFASWVNRKNPFSANASGDFAINPTLESFLSFHISHFSGGHEFSVGDITLVAKAAPLLIVLDGFDEIADVPTRARVVEEISKASTRLSAVGKSIRFIVTSRPAVFANSPGFSLRDWRHFELGDMTPKHVAEYSQKWMSARRLNQKERSDFTAIISQKLAQPHLRDLARNPMQLTILLALIHTRGLSLPDKRTNLYDSYMELFFNRESEKSAVVREYRDLLIDVHRFLAWELHSQAEGRGGRGRISENDMKAVLRQYLSSEGHPIDLVDELFTGMVERVVAIVSRVQGTYEFEVQPLREYFAARFLYETAPYSPPGAERRGTKPDRFEAVSRNFYWLNVARFLAGCFSKGELASLASSIESLDAEEEFANLSHLRALAWMLLSDWVFTQQPNLVKQMIKFITTERGLRIFQAAIRARRTGVPETLPEKCGQADLVQVLQDQFITDNKDDTLNSIASLLRSNMHPDAFVQLWISMGDDSRSAPERWLSKGATLGVFEIFSKNYGKDLLAKHGAPVAMHLLRAGRYDVLHADSAAFLAALSGLLDLGEYVAARYPKIAKKEDLPVLISINEALSLHLYRDIFNERQQSPHGAISARRSRISDLAISAPLPSDLDENTRNSCSRFSDLFSQLSHDSSIDWRTSIEPWSAIVECGRSIWGERQALMELSVLAAGIRSKSSRGSQESALFDNSVPMCERARVARLKSGAPSWWIETLEQVNGHQNQYFPLLSLLSWGTPTTLLKVADRLSTVANKYEKYGWYRLVNKAEAIRHVSRNKSSRIDLTASDLATLQRHPRAAIALVPSIDFSARQKLYLKVFREYRGEDPAIVNFCAEISFRSALAGQLPWEEYLQVCANTYSNNSTSGWDAFEPDFYPHFQLPIAIAKKICGSPERYPMSLVSAAEMTLMRNVGSKVQRVTTISQREKWFG